MSSTKARGSVGPPKYLPTDLEDDFRPSEGDIEFAERFSVIANVIDECKNAELVALLLSTCRNQWMAVNGMFVDLQGILGAGRLPDLTSRGYRDFSEGKVASAAQAFGEALQLKSALGQKLRCWSRREELLQQLEEAIASPDRKRLERDQLDAWLLRQTHGPSIPGRIRQAQYLKLDLSDSHCPQYLELIQNSAAKLAAAMRIAHRICRVVTVAEGLEGVGVETQPDRLFELDFSVGSDPEQEQDRQAETEQKLSGAWAKLREATFAHAGEIGFSVSGAADGPIELRLPEGEPLQVEVEIGEEEAAVLRQKLSPALAALMARTLAVTEQVHGRVFEAFTPNVSTPPMPAPFVIDLTPDDLESSEERVRRFSVATADGRQQPPNTAKLALLRCGMPTSAFSMVRKGHIAYDTDQNEGARKARQIALAAVAEAGRQGAAFLAMPEVFLPRSAITEVRRAAEQAKVGLVAGLEYPEMRGGPINEVLVHVPGWDEPLYQRKQGPSVEELKHTAFESTLKLFFIRRTALGNLGVIVCSDLLELDLLWALASFDDKLDVVVICARNYKPEIFERLAIADAARLHALVAVVNSWTPREQDDELPSGKGTLVAQPDSDSPLLELADHTLPVDWTGEIAQPSIAIAELNVANIRARELERPGAHGYISPPRFARL